MVYKRPFADEEPHELAFKHPRHLEYSNQLALFVESVPCNDVPLEPHTSVVEGEVGKSQGEKNLVKDEMAELSVGANREFETSVPGSHASLSCVISNTNEEGSRSETPDQISFTHNAFKPDCPSVIEPEEIYSPLLDYYPRKLVSVGPDHQANIPPLGLKSIVNASGCLDAYNPHTTLPQCLGSDPTVDEDNEDKLMGTCIIPMSNSDMSAYNRDRVEHGFSDCSCLDGGSIRCVRQHIVEAREKLRETLGWETFVKLGFNDMGEEVARNWTEEEEEVFGDVVFSNTASSGRNFWNHLSGVFPSRTKKDIVNYYFNVFMLRRRAEQNRLDPMNIDSDNDEWQSSDEGENEFGMTEEDEDSAVEPPANQNDLYIEEHFCEDDEGGDEAYGSHDDSDVVNDGSVSGEDYNGSIEIVSDRREQKLHGGCSCDTEVQLVCMNSQNGGEDHDIQDDSCTSYECQPHRDDSYGLVDAGAETQESRVVSDRCEHLQYSYGELSGGIDQGYVFELSDAKLWDVEYLTGPKKDLDLLPTCSMIEEVFGEPWNNKGKDEKGSS